MGDSTGQQETGPGRRGKRGKHNKKKAPKTEGALMPTPPALLPSSQGLLPSPPPLIPAPYPVQLRLQRRLLRLLSNACQFLETSGANFQSSFCFYRDKSLAYYQHIRNVRGGLMEVYAKDHHGDQLSPINGRLDGLFFSVNMDERTGRPPARSIYGEMRLHVPPRALLMHPHNLYFTDFYCINSKPHYVTLVITRPGSMADQFCARNLLQLDWGTNAFLRMHVVQTPGGWDLRMSVTSRVWVEVLFTENVMIPHVVRLGAYFEPVNMQGHRSGGRVGHPKNPNCPICNVAYL